MPWYVAGLVLAFVVGSMVGDAIGTYHCVSTTTGQGSAHLSLAERGRIEVARSDYLDDARLLEKLTNQAGGE